MIEIKNLNKWFDDFHVLTDINETVERGQTLVICGPSGSGKSTLLRCINGLEPYQKGEVIVDGVSLNNPKTNLYKLRENIGMVFQRFELYPHMTALQNVSLWGYDIGRLAMTYIEDPQSGPRRLLFAPAVTQTAGAAAVAPSQL